MPSLRQIFLVFLKMGAFAFGGVYSMLSFFQPELVDRRRWLTEEEFAEGVAIGQITPGPLTVMNAFIGYRVAGIAGAVAATAGSYLPSLIVVTWATKYYLRFKDSRVVAAVFRGIKPAVVGMLAAVAISLGTTSLAGPLPALIGGAVFALVTFTRIDATLVVLGAGVAGAALL